MFAILNVGWFIFVNCLFTIVSKISCLTAHDSKMTLWVHVYLVPSVAFLVPVMFFKSCHHVGGRILDKSNGDEIGKNLFS